MLRIDVHQHLWDEALLAALSARSSVPRARLKRGSWTLELAGEPDSRLPVESVEQRAATVHADGFDRALIALSSALGAEQLRAEDAEPLLAAHAALVDRSAPLAGATARGDADDRPSPTADRASRTAAAPLGIWAAVSLIDSTEAIADRAPEALAGAAGLCLPAAALVTPVAVERLAPLLAVLEASGKPLFVHPGPAAAPDGAPGWWPALSDYVAQLQAAWLAFAEAGRPAHPRLRVLFAALGGLAPLHAERIAARGGPAHALRDSNLFYDTSSYGSHAIGAVAQRVGRAQLVHGSDRPVLDPAASSLADDALATDNAARLLGPDLIQPHPARPLAPALEDR